MTDVAFTGPVSGDLVISDLGFVAMVAGTSVTKPIGFGVLNYTYTTDDQGLTVTLGDQGYYDQAGTYLYTHSDTAHTVGAYCKLTNDQVVIGSYTRSGSIYAYTPFSGGTASANLTPQQAGASRVEFRNVGTTWSVLVESMPVLSVTNSSVTFSSARRTAAVSLERKHSSVPVGPFPAGDFESFRIAAITMNDHVIPAFVGSGAKVSNRTNSIATANSSGAVFPSSWFDTIEYATDDITVDRTTSKFTVLLKAHYKLVLTSGNRIVNGTGAGLNFTHLLYVNGALREYGNTLMPSYDGTQTVWPGTLQSTFVVYLSPGDYVQAAYLTSGSLARGFAGDTSGQTNTFSIALLTQNLL